MLFINGRYFATLLGPAISGGGRAKLVEIDPQQNGGRSWRPRPT